MNRAIASLYAISIGSRQVEGNFAPEVQKKLVEHIPHLVGEIQRLEKIVHDPLVQGALQMRGRP